jgi:hypothetical protein
MTDEKERWRFAKDKTMKGQYGRHAKEKNKL